MDNFGHTKKMGNFYCIYKKQLSLYCTQFSAFQHNNFAFTSYNQASQPRSN